MGWRERVATEGLRARRLNLYPSTASSLYVCILSTFGPRMDGTAEGTPHRFNARVLSRPYRSEKLGGESGRVIHGGRRGQGRKDVYHVMTLFSHAADHVHQFAVHQSASIEARLILQTSFQVWSLQGSGSESDLQSPRDTQPKARIITVCCRFVLYVQQSYCRQPPPRFVRGMSQIASLLLCCAICTLNRHRAASLVLKSRYLQ